MYCVVMELMYFTGLAFCFIIVYSGWGVYYFRAYCTLTGFPSLPLLVDWLRYLSLYFTFLSSLGFGFVGLEYIHACIHIFVAIVTTCNCESFWKSY